MGSAEFVKLADARKVAADNRAIARTGGDPRRWRVPTFEKTEAVCFAEMGETWRSHGPAKNWRSAMDRYVLPKLGTMPVDKVGSAAVYEVLRAIAVAGKHATVKVREGYAGRPNPALYFYTEPRRSVSGGKCCKNRSARSSPSISATWRSMWFLLWCLRAFLAVSLQRPVVSNTP